MKTTILILSLIGALTFAAIINNSDSQVRESKPQVTDGQNFPADLNNEMYNSGTSGGYDNQNYTRVSYNGDNSYQNENDNYTYDPSQGYDSNYTEDPSVSGDTISFQTIQSTLSSDGQFVKVNEDQIDPENETAGTGQFLDDDVWSDDIWVPNTNYTEVGWNPYTNGSWVWTSWGWSWNSYYNWGLTYHYGRWWYSPIYGWVWSPGRRWAPAWVYWSHHRYYEGWYPISPRFHHREWNYTEYNHHFKNNRWIFVKKEDFRKPVTISTIMPYSMNKDILSKSTQTLTLNDQGNKIINTVPVSITTDPGVKNKIDKKSQDNVKNTVIKNAGNKNIPVIKNDTKIKPVDNGKKNQIISKKTETNNKREDIQKINSKNLINQNVTETGNKKKIDNNTVSTKSGLTNNKQSIDNKSVIKNIKTDNGVNKNGNTGNSGTKNVDLKRNNINTGNNNIKNDFLKKDEVKIGNTNRTDVKPTNNSRTMNITKTSNTETKVTQVQKVNPAPKVNYEQKVNPAPRVNTEQKVNPAPKVNTVQKENPVQQKSNNRKGS